MYLYRNRGNGHLGEMSLPNMGQGRLAPIIRGNGRLGVAPPLVRLPLMGVSRRCQIRLAWSILPV
jgi:hypothetical protein